MTRCSVCGQDVEQPARGYRLSHSPDCKSVRDALNAATRWIKSLAAGELTMDVTDEARAALRGELEAMLKLLA